MQEAVDLNSPPYVKGQQVKLRYAHLGGKNPHLILIYGSKVKLLPKIYLKYLKNYFYKKLELEGIQLKLVLKDK